MSLLSTKYYVFLQKHTLDFDSILSSLEDDNINLKDWCLQYDFINCQLQDLLENYPKFLTYSNIVNYSINLYNQNKIMTSTNMSVEQLNASIVDDSCHFLLNKIRYTPNNYDDLNKEYTFQNNFFTKFNNIYNKDLFLHNYETKDYTKNFSGLLNDSYDTTLNKYQKAILDKQSFFHLYFLKSLFGDYFSKKSTLNNNLVNNSSLLDLNTDLAAVLDNNNIISSLIDVILINQYSFTDISQDFKNTLIQNTNVQSKILNIEDVFNNYLAARSSDLKENYIQTCFDLQNHAFSFEFINSIFNSKSIFNFKGLNALSYNLYSVSEPSEFENLQVLSENYAETLYEFEQQMLTYFQTSLNDSYSLKQYFYLLYLNRTQFEKFINVIDLVASTYVFNDIRLDDIYYFNKFSHLKNLFIDWTKNIYYVNMQKALTKAYTSSKQKEFLDHNKNIISFSFIHTIYDIIEDFITTDEFSDYLKDVQLEVYNQLRTLGYIDPNIDWCSCDLPLKVCVMALLKTFVLDPDFFDTTDTINYIKDQMDISEYSVDSKENFDIFTQDFIDANASPMFDFYQTFLTSLNGSIFSRAIHNLYKL